MVAVHLGSTSNGTIPLSSTLDPTVEDTNSSSSNINSSSSSVVDLSTTMLAEGDTSHVAVVVAVVVAEAEVVCLIGHVKSMVAVAVKEAIIVV